MFLNRGQQTRKVPYHTVCSLQPTLYRRSGVCGSACALECTTAVLGEAGVKDPAKRCAAHLVALEGANPVAAPTLTQHGLAIFARASKEITIGGNGTAQRKHSPQCSLESVQHQIQGGQDASGLLNRRCAALSQDFKTPQGQARL